MRCRFWLFALVVMLARCGTAEPSLQADPASITPSPIDVVAPTATLPAASVTPTLPP